MYVVIIIANHYVCSYTMIIISIIIISSSNNHMSLPMQDCWVSRKEAHAPAAVIMFSLLYVVWFIMFLAQDKGGPSKGGFLNNILFRKPPLLGPPLSLPDVLCVMFFVLVLLPAAVIN